MAPCRSSQRGQVPCAAHGEVDVWPSLSQPPVLDEAPRVLGRYDAIDRKGYVDSSFFVEVDRWWSKVETAWDFLMYSTGVADGERWSRELAATEELRRIQSLASCRAFLRGEDDFNPMLTAAHVVLRVAKGLSRIPSRNEMETFWGRFLSVDLDDLKCRLFEPSYAEGFVDGALDLTGQLKAKTFEADRTAAK